MAVVWLAAGGALPREPVWVKSFWNTKPLAASQTCTKKGVRIIANLDLHAALGLLMPETAPQLLKDFATVWLGKRGSRSMPTFQDLDPLDMPWALNSIFVLRRRDDGLFAYQVVGEGMATRLGGRLKGKTAFDVFEDSYAEWTEARWQKAATERSACFVHTQHLTAAGVPLNAERLMFPLQGESDRVDSLIGVTEFSGRVSQLRLGDGQVDFLEIIWTPVDQL